jgi:hypothetical protein
MSKFTETVCGEVVVFLKLAEFFKCIQKYHLLS